VAIPKMNEPMIADLLVTGGARPIAAIQIFTLETFDDAVALARAREDRESNLKAAIAKFEEVHELLRGRPLTDRQVQEGLREVFKLAPNHATAKYLLLQGLGRQPKQLTLQGSLRQIDVSAAPMIDAIQEGAFEERKSGLDADAYGKAMSNLRLLKPKLDKRTRDCVDAVYEYSELIRRWVNERPKSDNNQIKLIEEIISAEDDLKREYDALMNRADVRRELF
jgi:hypothetical protein